MNHVACVIPAYNEEGRVGHVVAAARRFVDAVIVVDDGSVDGTAAEARSAGARVLTIPHSGVGYATVYGNDYASRSFAMLVNLDADGEHSPQDIPAVLRVLDSSGVDVVICSRRPYLTPFVKRLGNRFLNLAFRLFFNSSFSDSQSGFRAIRSASWRSLSFSSRGYPFCSEFAFRVKHAGLSFAEFPVFFRHSGKKGTTVADGVFIFLSMLRWRLVGV